jgi:hypothetical protein
MRDALRAHSEQVRLVGGSILVTEKMLEEGKAFREFADKVMSGEIVYSPPELEYCDCPYCEGH